MNGKDATAVEAIWKDLWTTTMTYGRGGIACMAMSALDIALWDAVGKRAGLPLHRLWGHYRSEIPIYGSGCFRGSGGDGMIAKAQHLREARATRRSRCRSRMCTRWRRTSTTCGACARRSGPTSTS